MKRINEILKSLNFPKFYDKSYEENGEVYYCFDNFAVREYNYNDNKLFLKSIPFTEETIHTDDVEFIIQYLRYCLFCKLDNNVKNYLFKLVEERDYNHDSPKIEKIIETFSEIVRKLVLFGPKTSKHTKLTKKELIKICKLCKFKNEGDKEKLKIYKKELKKMLNKMS